MGRPRTTGKRLCATSWDSMKDIARTYGVAHTTIARLAEGVSACGTTMMANYLNIQFYDKDGRTRIRIQPPGESRNVASLPLGTSFDRTINHLRHGPDVGTILCNIS